MLLELGRVGHMLLSLQYPRFCNYLHFAFFPSGAAVCAQHMELNREKTRNKQEVFMLWHTIGDAFSRP
ncbi:MAG: hypothetical protein VYC97_06220 [SAR324 cluster bacterium]|nr:hypothetical protein [SAR324 cluster bacterium]